MAVLVLVLVLTLESLEFVEVAIRVLAIQVLLEKSSPPLQQGLTVPSAVVLPFTGVFVKHLFVKLGWVRAKDSLRVTTPAK